MSAVSDLSRDLRRIASADADYRDLARGLLAAADELDAAVPMQEAA